MSFPRKVTALHQIEITSRCNLRCRYCVHPTMPRAKVDMDRQTFRNALACVEYFMWNHDQRELNLCGIGESTIHPNFIEFLEMARILLPARLDIVLATNGVSMTRELARAMVPARPRVWVSLHRPEKAGPAVEILKEVGLLAGVSADPSIAATNWAGQVKWHTSAQERTCKWLADGWIMMMADGRVTTCSFDGQGSGTIATDKIPPESWQVSPYELCKTCDQKIQDPDWDQQRGQRK